MCSSGLLLRDICGGVLGWDPCGRFPERPGSASSAITVSGWICMYHEFKQKGLRLTKPVEQYFIPSKSSRIQRSCQVDFSQSRCRKCYHCEELRSCRWIHSNAGTWGLLSILFFGIESSANGVVVDALKETHHPKINPQCSNGVLVRAPSGKKFPPPVRLKYTSGKHFHFMYVFRWTDGCRMITYLSHIFASQKMAIRIWKTGTTGIPMVSCPRLLLYTNLQIRRRSSTPKFPNR